jgi:hypothetical protein
MDGAGSDLSSLLWAVAEEIPCVEKTKSPVAVDLGE